MRLRTSTRSEPCPQRGARRRGASVAGMLLVAIVSATPRSPYYPVLPDGVEAQGPASVDRRPAAAAAPGRRRADARRARSRSAAAAFGFILILREAWHQRISMRMVVRARDRVPRARAHPAAAVLARRLQLRVLRAHREHLRCEPVRPHAAATSRTTRCGHLTWPGWRDTPSVYGPLFTWVSVMTTGVLRSVDSHGPRVPGARGVSPASGTLFVVCAFGASGSVPSGPSSRSP